MATWRPNLKSDQAEIWCRCSVLKDMFSQSQDILGQALTKRAHFVIFSNFDLCDLEK
jgi:hypothetical protein